MAIVRVGSPAPFPAISGYEIIRDIHQRATSAAYEALQISTKRKMAIKLLVFGLDATDDDRRRCKREIERTNRLRHADIIKVLDMGTTAKGVPFFAMDFVEGHPLDKYVRENNLPFEDVLELFAKVCDVVHYAHQRGVVHSNLQPSNILVTAEGSPRILGFGLLHMFEDLPIEICVPDDESIEFSCGPTAADVCRSFDEYNTRWDLHLLGRILYQLLTGHPPYPMVKTVSEWKANVNSAPERPPRKWTAESGVKRRRKRRFRLGRCPIDKHVEAIIITALSIDREQGYQCVGELARDIRKYLAGKPIQAERVRNWR